MKRTTLALLMLVGFAVKYAEPAAPKPISVQTPTENSIVTEMRHEELQRQYARAAFAARAVYRKNGCRPTFAEITGKFAVDYHISPRLLAGLIFVESSCNSNAISGKASVGLMQVNPLVWKYSRAQLLNPNRNLEVGVPILAAYIRKHGLVEGLHHFNGLGNPTNEYAEKVLAAAGLTS